MFTILAFVAGFVVGAYRDVVIAKVKEILDHSK